MSMLSDVDVRRCIGKEIVIEPFLDNLLTPVGYDFTIGNFVFSLEDGLLNPANGAYELPAKSTLQILTRESLWVSRKIGGTFHAKVSLVSRGLSHISTTLDPGWYGPLLITMRNNTNKIIQMNEGDSFVTLVFSKLETPTSSPHFKPEFRKDILLSQINHQTEDYIRKVASLLGDPKILAEFEKKVRSANEPTMSLRVSSSVESSVKSDKRHGDIDFLTNLVFAISITSLLLLQFYWDKVKPLFHNIEYDSRIFISQFTLVIALLSLFLHLKRK